MIHQLFPTTIYSAQLESDDDTWHAMFAYVEQFRLKTQQSETMDSNLFTGDIYSDYVIHLKEQFQWLNGQIGRHMRLYLEELGVDTAQLDIYAQKSWPTVCNKENGMVEEHTHDNAHFSCVYYLSVDEDNYSGNLYLRNPNTLNVNKLPVPLKKANSSNDTHHQIIPKNDLLVIFPAYLPHYVSVYNGDDYRYSISYDLSVTARPDTDKNEHLVSHLSQWVALGDAD